MIIITIKLIIPIHCYSRNTCNSSPSSIFRWPLHLTILETSLHFENKLVPNQTKIFWCMKPQTILFGVDKESYKRNSKGQQQTPTSSNILTIFLNLQTAGDMQPMPHTATESETSFASQKYDSSDILNNGVVLPLGTTCHFHCLNNN
ncbi:hypothetical protein SO802_005518 [Lithocarpus litseifolius]|uniref:Uncharacterized protein n=1 Tax=Lithocarpus litseifolius TaxID=425828 RepID=A0AAW2DID3_9ROSI